MRDAYDPAWPWTTEEWLAIEQATRLHAAKQGDDQ